MMLSVDNLSVAYGMIEALHGVSVKIDAGEIVTLIGSNGAGKTTLLRTISGLISSKSGSIHFRDREITRLPAHEIVAAGISHSPEGRQVFANLTVRENLNLGAYLQTDKKQIRADIEH